MHAHNITLKNGPKEEDDCLQPSGAPRAFLMEGEQSVFSPLSFRGKFF